MKAVVSGILAIASLLLGSRTAASQALHVAFETPIGTYLSFAPNAANALTSGATRIGQSEQFVLVSLGGSTYAIQPYNTFRHLHAVNGGGIGRTGAVRTDGADANGPGRFTLECDSVGWCALKTSRGFYVASGGGIVRADERAPTPATLFRLLTPVEQPQPAQTSAARAKTGVILGQIAGPVVLGDVGVDRMGSWEDAVGGGGVSRSRAGATLHYDHLVAPQAPGASGEIPQSVRIRDMAAAADAYWREEDKRRLRGDAPAATPEDETDRVEDDIIPRPGSDIAPPGSPEVRLCGVEGRWKGDYNIVRSYAQSGNTVTANTDYFFGFGMRKEIFNGVLKEIDGGLVLEWTMDITEYDGVKKKQAGRMSVTCEPPGIARRLGNQTRVMQ